MRRGPLPAQQRKKKGHFELADKGTIFLDEIGDIPIPTQISLLRVLESGTFQRVGGTRTLKVDTRVVCATNKDLSSAVKEKHFRANLPKELKESSQKKEVDLRLSSRSLPLAEATIIRKVLEETDWNLKQAAKELDIARGTLYSKMKKYGIEKPQ